MVSIILIARPVQGQQLFPVADHHLHVGTKAVSDFLTEYYRLKGKNNTDKVRKYLHANVTNVIRALDSAHIKQGALLSTAYLFGMPDIEVKDEYARVRAENDFTVQQAAKYPNRLAAVCSVNPLADYALAEIERCGKEPGFSGLKLHFTNSNVDLRDNHQLTQLRLVFELAQKYRLPIAVHMRTRNPNYGHIDVNAFINKVLVHVEDLPVQVAHMAGWGGYDDATDDALQTFAEAFRTRQLKTERITFDLAAVVKWTEENKDNSATDCKNNENAVRLRSRVRQIGLDKIVYATDWPSHNIEQYVDAVVHCTGLEKADLENIFNNRGAVLRNRVKPDSM